MNESTPSPAALKLARKRHYGCRLEDGPACSTCVSLALAVDAHTAALRERIAELEGLLSIEVRVAEAYLHERDEAREVAAENWGLFTVLRAAVRREIVAANEPGPLIEIAGKVVQGLRALEPLLSEEP